MKKLLLSTALLAITGAASHAQGVSIGIKAGASLTSAVGDGTTGFDYKNKFGFHGGLVANLPISDVFSIQPELLYSMKGYKFRGSDGLGGGPILDKRQTLNYIDVPILARINAGSLFFEVGPQFGYLVSAKYSVDGSGNNSSSYYRNRDSFRKVDFGYAAGLGYQLANGPGIGLRYNGSFKNFAEYYGSGGTRNSAFQLYLSYMFGRK